MTQDRPALGIILMLGFCVLAPLGDSIAKLLGPQIPLGQLLFVRFAIQALLLLPLVWMTARPWRASGHVLWLIVLRTLLHIAGIGAMFTALVHLPLADAIAIAFVMPFLMLLLGKFVLGEEVGVRRLGACVVGFIGTLLVIQPSFAEVGWPALWPLAVAVTFALFMLVTRRIAKETDPIALQAVSGVIASAILFPALLWGHQAGIPALSVTFDISDTWWLLAAIGILGTCAHLLMTWSLRFAPSATLAPMQYLEIPVATAFGWLIFRDFPDQLAAIGILVTMASGLYVILREHRMARQSDAEVIAGQPHPPEI
ncbi:DMT family transporter [Arenibacterium halophilum]|uniref:DMT family transporter n=1 Tax=Arenibacterium halophilum TaxID=2583821 RepID=A0ABY2X9X1_9RHOB|nr:DMT family transporter [Arenibacterium halophilum]TMV12848.1 DMT family transporter [Arenibacterium halophilum]